MEITSEARDGNVLERHFTLTVGDEAVPGIHWLPADATEPHATVCIGHGGFQHKRIDNVVGLGRPAGPQPRRRRRLPRRTRARRSQDRSRGRSADAGGDPQR